MGQDCRGNIDPVERPLAPLERSSRAREHELRFTSQQGYDGGVNFPTEDHHRGGQNLRHAMPGNPRQAFSARSLAAVASPDGPAVEIPAEADGEEKVAPQPMLQTYGEDRAGAVIAVRE